MKSVIAVTVADACEVLQRIAIMKAFGSDGSEQQTVARLTTVQGLQFQNTAVEPEILEVFKRIDKVEQKMATEFEQVKEILKSLTEK